MIYVIINQYKSLKKITVFAETSPIFWQWSSHHHQFWNASAWDLHVSMADPRCDSAASMGQLTWAVIAMIAMDPNRSRTWWIYRVYNSLMMDLWSLYMYNHVYTIWGPGGCCLKYKKVEQHYSRMCEKVCTMVARTTAQHQSCRYGLWIWVSEPVIFWTKIIFCKGCLKPIWW